MLLRAFSEADDRLDGAERDKPSDLLFPENATQSIIGR